MINQNARTVDSFFRFYNFGNRQKFTDAQCLQAGYALCEMMLLKSEDYDGIDRLQFAMSTIKNKSAHNEEYVVLVLNDLLHLIQDNRFRKPDAFDACLSSIYNIFTLAFGFQHDSSWTQLQIVSTYAVKFLRFLGYKQQIKGRPESDAIVLNILREHLS